ncbi:MAG: nuclear transport factor 2 family protein [Alteromonadaceae bacterium]|nr:nuclear transport factor 2 family protein [Alteromonadaceae bacterium]
MEYTMIDTKLDKWHKVVLKKDLKLLHELLAEDVEFHSPTVWQPKLGRDVTHYILEMVIDIFQNFEYHREWVDGNNMALEFSATVDDKKIKGIDLITWNDEGQIIHFEVMLRPLNGLQLMLEKMTQKLQQAGFVK